MNDNPWHTSDPAQARLRVLLEGVDREVTTLLAQAATEDHTAVSGRLADAWSKLVEQLAPGPEPEMRACPFCQRMIFRLATRCRYCWQKSEAELGA